MRIARIQVACCVASLLLASDASAGKLFFGSIAYLGPGVNPAGDGEFHIFVARSRLGVTFSDWYGKNTRYRFCWRKRGSQAPRCWKPRRTGFAESRSIIETAAPGRPGSYLGTWYVRGHPVAGWRFRVVAAGH
jgi:hypothetical protein